MSEPGPESLFYDLLFELSNEIRHSILQLLIQKPERMTKLSKILDLTTPEISRHLSRLTEKRLIEKDKDNSYFVTNLGKYILNSLVDLEFITKNIDYFSDHNAGNIPIKFQKRLSEISDFRYETNFMSFIGYIIEAINQSTRYVWLFIDQYPQFAKSSILSALERGVKFRVIITQNHEETKNKFDLKYTIQKNDQKPLLALKTSQNNDVYLFLSDRGSAICFPSKGEIDYTGFVCGVENTWVRELFLHYWNPSESAHAQCALCMNPITTEYFIEIIEGKELVFDTVDCVDTYRQLKQVYGEHFK